MLNKYESQIRSPWFWLPVIFILPSAAIFWVSDLDNIISALYFLPDASSQNWEGNGDVGVRILYHSINVMTTIVITTTLVIILAANATRRWRNLRIKATFILLTFLIGPGLLVNTIFKDNWGRPRPRDTTPFGGSEVYVPPLKFNAAGDGRSFPSGHASAGFALLSFYLLARRRRSQSAGVILTGVLGYTALVGYARIAEGGHYLSDIIWAGWITAGATYMLYKVGFEKLLQDE